jgi:hypothetical protein
LQIKHLSWRAATSNLEMVSMVDGRIIAVVPAPDGDRVVAKRGVPPLGAIKPEASATRKQ